MSSGAAEAVVSAVGGIEEGPGFEEDGVLLLLSSSESESESDSDVLPSSSSSSIEEGTSSSASCVLFRPSG